MIQTYSHSSTLKDTERHYEGMTRGIQMRTWQKQLAGISILKQQNAI